MRKVWIATVIALVCVVQVGAQDADRALFNEAESRFLSQDYELAVERYEALLRQYPLSDFVPDAQFKRALSLYRLGRDEEALTLFQRVASRYRSTQYLPYVPFWQGVVLYRLGDYDQALESLYAFVEQSDEEELVQQARLYVALSHTAQGQDDQAVAALEELLERTDSMSGESYAVALLASLYFRRDRHEAVIALYTQANPAALAERWRWSLTLYAAESYFAVEDYATAVELYESLTTAELSHRTVAYQRLFQIASQGEIGDSQDILRRAERDLAGRPEVLKDFWLRVGIESYSIGKLDLAELYFRRIWDLRESVPVAVTTPLYLAEVLSAQGSTSQAAVVLREQLQYSDEQRPRVLARLGALHVQREEWSEARDRLRESIDAGLDGSLLGQAWYHYAFALSRLEELQEALQAVREPLSTGVTGGYTAELLRLQASIYRRLGRLDDALQSLRDFVALVPDDRAARLELIQLNFLLENFAQVIAEGESLAADSEQEIAQLQYMLGLARISERSYRQAIDHLSRVPEIPPADPDYEESRVIEPYRLYYLGWSQFRLGRFADAQASLGTLVDEFPGHPFAAEAAYLAGFSAYSAGSYDQAAGLLRRAVGLTADRSQAAQAAFLLAQSLRDGGDTAGATVQFQSVAEEYPQSEYADDALYEYALVQRTAGRPAAAQRAYRRIVEEHPDSSLAGEALYRIAELHLAAEEYESARDTYFEYRSAYPNDEFFEAALYWGGVASAAIGEDSGALLQWERLIAEYPEASVRPEAMRRAATLYEERGEYRKALNLYTGLIAAYPREAEAAGAERKRDELVLLIGGVDQREAELLVTIEENDRAATRRGREAIIALGQLAIGDSLGSSVADALVLPMLRETVAIGEEDPDAAAEAQFLLAEHAYNQEEYRTAGTRYLEVVTIRPSDRDLMAQSLYRAAEMMKLAGENRYSRQLVEQLEEQFPTSEWTAQAGELHAGGDR